MSLHPINQRHTSRPQFQHPIYQLTLSQGSQDGPFGRSATDFVAAGCPPSFTAAGDFVLESWVQTAFNQEQRHRR
jgi:hypothetical protein